MKKYINLGLVVATLFASTPSWAVDAYWNGSWLPGANARSATPAGSANRAIGQQLAVLPTTLLYDYEAAAAELQKKKVLCHDDFVTCYKDAQKKWGYSEADWVNACATEGWFSGDTTKKCKGIKVCEKNNQVLDDNFKLPLSAPSNKQSPVPFIAVNPICKKTALVDGQGQSYTDYVISSQITCNPALYPVSGESPEIEIHYSAKVPPHMDICKVSEGTQYDDIPVDNLMNLFSVTTIENLIDKMGAYLKSKGQTLPITYQKSNFGPLGLKDTACMFLMPLKGGLDYAVGTYGMGPAKFPPDSKIMKLPDGKFIYMLSISTEQKGIGDGDPNICVVKFKIK